MMIKLKVVLHSALFILFFKTGATQSLPSNQKSILMVLSSYGKEKGKLRPGFELDEVSQAYYVFKSNGLKITIASPKGGKVEGDKFNKQKPYNQKFLLDSQAVALLDNTLPTALVQKNDYDAIYIVGGKGAMFDLPYDPSLQDLVKDMFMDKKVIGSVCHGSAAFVNVKLNDSTFFIKGREITGLCNEEETKFGKKWITEFPYLLETKLKERGAKYKSEEIMLPFVVVDDKLISGQNPYSTTAVAEEIVKSLGIKLQDRALYPDEKSMLLVKKALSGNYTWAKNEIKEKNKEYDLELIAVYGYYGLLFAENDVNLIEKSLNIIDLVFDYQFNENLYLEKSKALIKLNKKQEAKALLEALVQKNLLKNEALKLLEDISK